MSIATKLQAILSAKGDIKAAIEGKGVTVGNASLDQYANKIGEIASAGDVDGMNGFLSVESKTIQTSASATTNITYNKNCGILDENYKKWDTLDWHQRWVDNGYSATGLSAPIGIWMKAFGMDLTYLWRLTTSSGYYDISGTQSLSTTTFPLWLSSTDMIYSATSADRTVWPANASGNISHGTAGKYKSATWRATNNGDGLDMVCDNTLETFTIPSRSVGNANAFRKNNNDDYVEAYYQQCEFYRALFAICSGVSTTSANGTTTTVEILNSSGQQAAVGEDMYFWIGGTNTGLLAKYNLNCKPSRTSNVSTANLTQAITDAIYAKQIAAGINMNDTGVNSSEKHILVEGMKGAEAIAVSGYWYIKTPYIPNPGTGYTIHANRMDAAAIYFCKARGVSIPTERMLLPYWLNISTHIASIVNLLRSTEGLSTFVPAVVDAICWSAIMYWSNSAWYVAMNTGTIGNGGGVSMAVNECVIPCCLSTQQYTT